MTEIPIISLPLKLVAALGVLVAIAAIVALASALTYPAKEHHAPVPPPIATLSPR